jgi:hypothetical protein
VSTGEEFLNTLEGATARFGAVKNLVLYGHGGYKSIYMKNDAGFYKDPDSNGPSAVPDERMRELGARTITDLKKKLTPDEKTGVAAIEFAPDATIILGACNCGSGSMSLAKDLALASGATVIAAGTGAQPTKEQDPSKRDLLLSEGGWFSFKRVMKDGKWDVKVESLQTTVIDPKKFIKR